jgi:hypothetical protein
MKRILLSVVVLATVYSVSAQEVTVTRMPVNHNSSASVPPYIRANFETAYPGITVITWEPVSPYWRASYKVNNRVTYVFYDERGNDYRVALPVIQTNVPEEVVTTAVNLYGPSVYGILKMKSADNGDVYQVRLLENGMTRSVWMDANGTAVTNVFKAKTGEGTVVTVSNQ